VRRIAKATLITTCLLAAGCSNKADGLRAGIWRATLQTPGGPLPFGLEIQTEDSLIAFIVNGSERILVRDIVRQDDSLFIRLPVFDSEIRARVTGTAMQGRWIDYNRESYAIPFSAEHDVSYRFAEWSKAVDTLTEAWEVTFSPGAEGEFKAKGIFTYHGSRAFGTFLTETGDYRFLEGDVVDDSLFLSCFDGSHAFLFKAYRTGDSMSGMFWSGKHWQEPWVAVLNPGFMLRDPDSLTFLKPGFERFEFSFPDADGNLVSLNDFGGRVVIVQIMGSWCPNCMDEARFFADAWRKHHDDGLDIIGLAFEKTRNFQTARERVMRMQEHLALPYPILVAGFRDPKEVAEKLPALNRLMSYPTSIFIDRTGEVKRIHTGFNGPATGAAYTAFVGDFNAFVQSLLRERAL
jgi:peroxiredoxin